MLLGADCPGFLPDPATCQVLRLGAVGQSLDAPESRGVRLGQQNRGDPVSHPVRQLGRCVLDASAAAHLREGTLVAVPVHWVRCWWFPAGAARRWDGCARVHQVPEEGRYRLAADQSAA